MDSSGASAIWDEGTIENQILLEALPDLPAEKIYERQWPLTPLDLVFARLPEECAAAGKAQLFEALGMYLSGEKANIVAIHEVGEHEGRQYL